MKAHRRDSPQHNGKGAPSGSVTNEPAASNSAQATAALASVATDPVSVANPSAAVAAARRSVQLWVVKEKREAEVTLRVGDAPKRQSGHVEARNIGSHRIGGTVHGILSPRENTSEHMKQPPQKAPPGNPYSSRIFNPGETTVSTQHPVENRRLSRQERRSKMEVLGIDGTQLLNRVDGVGPSAMDLRSHSHPVEQFGTTPPSGASGPSMLRTSNPELDRRAGSSRSTSPGISGFRSMGSGAAPSIPADIASGTEGSGHNSSSQSSRAAENVRSANARRIAIASLLPSIGPEWPETVYGLNTWSIIPEISQPVVLNVLKQLVLSKSELLHEGFTMEPWSDEYIEKLRKCHNCRSESHLINLNAAESWC